MRLLLISTLLAITLALSCSAHKKRQDLENALVDVIHDNSTVTGLSYRSKRAIVNFCLGNEQYDDYTPAVCVANYQKYRSYTGACNNQGVAWWGASQTPQKRFIKSDYDDGISSMRYNSAVKGKYLPHPRTVGNKFLSRYTSLSKTSSAFFTQFSRFVNMDISFTPQSLNSFDNSPNKKCNCLDPTTNTKDCLFLNVPKSDYYSQAVGLSCFSFQRSMPSVEKFSCNLGARQQLNEQSSFLDLSNIYGTVEKSKYSVTEDQAKLQSDTTPVNELTALMLPATTTITSAECPVADIINGYYKTVNGQEADGTIIAQYNIWTRQHNFIVDKLAALSTATPKNWYAIREIARKINIGIFQHVIYNEFIPHAIGVNAAEKLYIKPTKSGYSNSYDTSVNPSIYNEFAAAAIRNQNMIPQKVCRQALGGTLECEDKRKSWKSTKYVCESHDAYIYGALNSRSNANIPHYAEDLYNIERGATSSGVVEDIMRGRDHGIRGYTSYRKLCGVDKYPVRTFDDLHEIPPVKRAELKKLYKSVHDIDLWVGGIAELPKYGSYSQYGPTFTCLIGNQFRTLKRADRHFYENDSDLFSKFDQEQLAEIKKETVARVLCRNTAAVDIPSRPFGNDRSYKVNCAKQVSIDFSKWTAEVNEDIPVTP